MRRGKAADRARATRPLAPSCNAEEEADLARALEESLRIFSGTLTRAAQGAAPAATDSEWELVNEPAAEPEARGATVGSAAAAPAAPCVECGTLAEATSGIRELRIYLVWSIAGPTAWAGVHCAEGLAAYEGIGSLAR